MAAYSSHGESSFKLTVTTETGLMAMTVESLIDVDGHITDNSKGSSRERSVNTNRLFAFQRSTQQDIVNTLGIGTADRGVPRSYTA